MKTRSASSVHVGQRREKDELMSKRKYATHADDDPLDREIDFTNSMPNPFARDFGRSRNLRVLDPDLLDIFPDSDSVNEALRIIVRAAQTAQPRQKLSARRAAAPKSKKRKAS